MIVPAILFVLWLIMVFIYPTPSMGIDLKGGTSIIINGDKEINSKTLANLLSEKFPLEGLEVIATQGLAGKYGVIIQFIENKDFAQADKSLQQATDLLAANPTESRNIVEKALQNLSKYYSFPRLSEKPEEALNEAKNNVILAKQGFDLQMQEIIFKEFGVSKDSFAFQKREVGISLGQSFWQTAQMVAIIGLILIIIVVFAFFREFLPSAAIIFSGMFDVLTALALMSWFKIPLSLVSIPALLMLFGYSVDTDILLTTRVLKKRNGTARERAVDSMKTGMTMTITALISLGVMFVISYTNQITVLYEIAAVLLLGLTGDIIGTWFFNAPLLLGYVEKKEKQGK